jgi:hypothetical protein
LALAINQRPVGRDASSIAQTDVRQFADREVLRNSSASLLRLMVFQFLPETAACSLGLAVIAPEREIVSCGARLFQIRDPDRSPVTYWQWLKRSP